MIYITGDIHREQDIHKINPREFTVGDTLTENDYIIICGDFGCVWDGSTGDNFWLKWLDSLPWNTLFIDGNHENFDVLNTYPIEEYKGGKVHRIRSKVFHLMRGEIFDIDGKLLYAVDGGYLDIGLNDTMKDLFVNFIGALVFSIFAYIGLKNNKKSSVVKKFVPTKEKRKIAESVKNSLNI